MMALDGVSGFALRERAEEVLKNLPVHHSEFPVTDLHKLVHELQVHQIELQMQNQALLDAQQEIEQRLREFKDLYDLAPVAYFSLKRNGLLIRANVLGKRLLGISLNNFSTLRFSRFVSLESRPVFAQFFANLFDNGALSFCQLQLASPSSTVRPKKQRFLPRFPRNYMASQAVF